MEFISLGGLLPGLSSDDIRSGISQPRNKNLAEVFHRLRLIESYGTGIRRIFNLYADCPEQPEIEITTNTFKMILPNMNAVSTAEPENASAVTPQMQTVLDYITEHGQITDDEVQSLLGIKKTRAFDLVKQMREMGLVQRLGRGAEKRYLRS
jgi:ATP-dependent DNA helicase RecG